MYTLEKMMHSKYGTTWYRPKIIQKLWLKCVFRPVFLFTYIKAVIKTKGDTLNDPEMEWLYHYMAKHGYAASVISLIEAEYSTRMMIHDLKN